MFLKFLVLIFWIQLACEFEKFPIELTGHPKTWKILEGSLFSGRVKARIKEGGTKGREQGTRKEERRKKNHFRWEKVPNSLPSVFCFVSKQGRAPSSWSRVLGL